MILKGQLDKKTNATTATLRCALGTFYVADAARFPEGTTTGFFELLQLTPATVQRNASMLLVIDVTLGEVILQTALDVESTEQLSLTPTEAKVENAVDDNNENETDIEAQCKAVGLPTPLPAQFTIDATLARNVINQQLDVLKQQGYTFDAATQTWQRKEAA